MQRGDYIAVRSRGGFPSAPFWIRLGTFSRWNHAAIYLGDGYVAEAQPGGVAINRLTEYQPSDYVASRLPLTDAQRSVICAYARSKAGAPYGWLDIVGLILTGLGIRWTWLVNVAKRDDRVVCSQLVAYAYSAAGVPLAPDPWAVTPGDLAEFITEEN